MPYRELPRSSQRVTSRISSFHKQQLHSEKRSIPPNPTQSSSRRCCDKHMHGYCCPDNKRAAVSGLIWELRFSSPNLPLGKSYIFLSENWVKWGLFYTLSLALGQEKPVSAAWKRKVIHIRHSLQREPSPCGTCWIFSTISPKHPRIALHRAQSPSMRLDRWLLERCPCSLGLGCVTHKQAMQTGVETAYQHQLPFTYCWEGIFLGTKNIWAVGWTGLYMMKLVILSHLESSSSELCGEIRDRVNHKSTPLSMTSVRLIFQREEGEK